MPEHVMTLEEFETASLALAQEALSIPLSGTFTKLRAALPNYFANLKDFIQHRLFDNNAALDLLNQNKYSALANEGNYMALRMKPVIVPKGLNASYLDYLKVLEKAQDSVDLLIPETLTPFQKYLGALLSDPDTLKSQRQAQMLDTVTTHDLEPVQKDIQALFSQDNAENRTYGTLIQRQRDWPYIVSQFNDLVERMAKSPRSEILKSVETIGDYLDTLMKRVTEDPDAYAASGVTVSALAQLCYAMASEVEFYATQSFRIEALQVSIEAAADLVKKNS